MQVPTELDEWSFSAIKKLLRNGVFESETFDFKEMLPNSKDEGGKERLRKTITAFANSGGGFLVFGIKDDRSVAFDKRIIGIAPTEDLPMRFGNYPGACEPAIEWRFRNPPISIPTSNHVLHVCEIVSTWKRPHAVFINQAAFFGKRTSSGTEPMSYAEIKSAFHEAEFRRTKLALLISKVEHLRDTAEKLLRDAQAKPTDQVDPDHPWSWATRYSTTLLDMVIGDTYAFFSTDPVLWKGLCTLRECARASNALCEGFSSAVFFRSSERVGIGRGRLAPVQEAAETIRKVAGEMVTKLRGLLE